MSRKIAVIAVAAHQVGQDQRLQVLFAECQEVGPRLEPSPHEELADVVCHFITPAPVALTFPQLLIPQAVRVAIYPLETVVTEKFAALVEIGVDTTRMKDVYDLHVILGRKTFTVSVLEEALRRSFAVRGTPTLRVPAVLSDIFAQDPLLVARWEQYKRRTGAQAPSFRDVMVEVRAFFGPALLEQQGGGEWDPQTQKWSPGTAETEATS